MASMVYYVAIIWPVAYTYAVAVNANVCSHGYININ